MAKVYTYDGDKNELTITEEKAEVCDMVVLLRRRQHLAAVIATEQANLVLVDADIAQAVIEGYAGDTV